MTSFPSHQQVSYWENSVLVKEKFHFLSLTGCDMVCSEGLFGAINQAFMFPLPAIDSNYRVITLVFTKYGELPLCLDNYALFSLPLIFTKQLYLVEPSGNIISNYHGTFIQIFMHAYSPIYKNKIS